MLFDGVIFSSPEYRSPSLGVATATAGDSASAWVPASSYRSVTAPVVVSVDAPGAPGAAAVMPIVLDPSGGLMYAGGTPGFYPGLPPDPLIGEGGPTSSLAPVAKPAASSSSGSMWLPLLLAGAAFLLR